MTALIPYGQSLATTRKSSRALDRAFSEAMTEIEMRRAIGEEVIAARAELGMDAQDAVADVYEHGKSRLVFEEPLLAKLMVKLTIDTASDVSRIARKVFK